MGVRAVQEILFSPFHKKWNPPLLESLSCFFVLFYLGSLREKERERESCQHTWPCCYIVSIAFTECVILHMFHSFNTE